jgi:hypothetical protein
MPTEIIDNVPQTLSSVSTWLFCRRSVGVVVQRRRARWASEHRQGAPQVPPTLQLAAAHAVCKMQVGLCTLAIGRASPAYVFSDGLHTLDE